MEKKIKIFSTFYCRFSSAYNLILQYYPQISIVQLRAIDMNEYYLDLTNENTAQTINSKYLIGSTFEDSESIAWFNGYPFHAAPLSLNLIHNAIIRTYLGENYSISVINKPIGNFANSPKDDLSTMHFGETIIANISFAMAFVTAFSLVFYIKVYTIYNSMN